MNLYNSKNKYVFRFEPNNKNTLCSNIINKIVYGGDGFLWVSTSMGLNRFSLKDRKVTESYTEYPECLNVVSDSAGNTLLIKQKDFISCYSPETGSFQDVHVQGMNEEAVSYTHLRFRRVTNSETTSPMFAASSIRSMVG